MHVCTFLVMAQAAKAGKESITQRLTDYLIGEVDQVPKVSQRKAIDENSNYHSTDSSHIFAGAFPCRMQNTCFKCTWP